MCFFNHFRTAELGFCYFFFSPTIFSAEMNFLLFVLKTFIGDCEERENREEMGDGEEEIEQSKKSHADLCTS